MILSSCGLNSTYPSTYGELSSSVKEIDKSISDLSSEKLSGYVLYKPKCPVCIKNESEIIKTFREIDEKLSNFHYIDVSNGLPDKLVDSLAVNSLEGAKTPYLIVVDRDVKSIDDDQRFEPIVSMRLSSSDEIEHASKIINTIVERE